MADATTAPPGMLSAAAAASERIPPRRLVAFLIMVFGMFMSILDIQVVSASLSDIQAGLSASSTEVSWVQTAYLIAEVIAIPLSGFLSRAFGTSTEIYIAVENLLDRIYTTGRTSEGVISIGEPRMARAGLRLRF